jgi:hypothetical protein
MRTLTKKTTTITIAAALMLAMTASMFATADAVFGELIMLDSEQILTAIDPDDDDNDDHDTDTQVSSLRVTQSTEDGLDVECEGNVKCKIIGDDTVLATSDQHSTNSVTSAITTLNQSNIIQFGNDFDVVDEQEDLGARIEGMVDRLLDDLFA